MCVLEIARVNKKLEVFIGLWCVKARDLIDFFGSQGRDWKQEYWYIVMNSAE